MPREPAQEGGREPRNKGGRPITIGRAVKAYAQTVKQLDAISGEVEATLGIRMSRAATMAYVVDRYIEYKGASAPKTNTPPGT